MKGENKMAKEREGSKKGIFNFHNMKIEKN